MYRLVHSFASKKTTAKRFFTNVRNKCPDSKLEEENGYFVIILYETESYTKAEEKLHNLLKNGVNCGIQTI